MPRSIKSLFPVIFLESSSTCPSVKDPEYKRIRKMVSIQFQNYIFNVPLLEDHLFLRRDFQDFQLYTTGSTTLLPVCGYVEKKAHKKACWKKDLYEEAVLYDTEECASVDKKNCEELLKVELFKERFINLIKFKFIRLTTFKCLRFANRGSCRWGRG